MKKLLILSGKGGTGKTTAAAAFIRFAQAKAAADCDVDAPNLHLVLRREDEPERTPFYGADRAAVDSEACTGCGKCAKACRFGALQKRGDGKYAVLPYMCEGCGVCEYVCPNGAVSMQTDVAGTLRLFAGERVFSTAELRTGRGNSGKLVTEVKSAMLRAADKAAPLAVLDGSPGIGCPVIASVTGADLVLLVAEPSRSGLSDLKRILRTASVLHARTAVCVNKAGVCEEKSAEIERFCKSEGVPFVGKIPYDRQIPEAVNAGRNIADIDCPAKDALREVFLNTMRLLEPPEAEAACGRKIPFKEKGL